MVASRAPGPGLPRVRNMAKSGSTLPSARYHDLEGETPKVSVAPLTLTEPPAEASKGNEWSKYSGRSASTGTVADSTVEKPTTPGPTPSPSELASSVMRENLGRALVRVTVPPVSRPYRAVTTVSLAVGLATVK